MNKGLNGTPFLDSQPNFRSLEGIQSHDGRRFRKNMVYRSGGLGRLSPADIARLEGIRLCTIVDFRSDRERESFPTMKIPTVRQPLRVVINDVAREEAQVLLERNDPDGMEKVLVKDYRRMVKNDADRFAEFFRILQEECCFPLVYHCAAGKDRTGLATVLLLSALGVGMDDILVDYYESNERLKTFADLYVKKVNEQGFNGNIIRPMMEVRPEYIQAALDEIDLSFGGMQAYLLGVLGAQTELLKDKFLE